MEGEIKKAVIDFINKNYHGSETVEIKISGPLLPYDATLKIRPD